MPFYKRRNGFKRTYRSKRRYTSKPKMYQLQKQIRSVARMARPELKFLDNGMSSATVNPTGGFLVLNNMAAGTGQSARIGREITNKYLSAKFSVFVPPAAGGNGYTNGRFVIFIDRQPQAGTPSWTDIFNAASPFGFQNLDNVSRFKILKSKLLNFDGDPSNITSTISHNVSMNIRLRSKTTFDASGSISSNVIYFGYITDGSTAGLEISTADFRFRYTDS